MHTGYNVSYKDVFERYKVNFMGISMPFILPT